MGHPHSLGWGTHIVMGHPHGSGGDAGKLVAITDHKRGEVARIPIAGAVDAGSGETAPEPSEAGVVDPDGNANLVAGEEGDSSANAVNGGTVGEVLFKVEAETLL